MTDIRFFNDTESAIDTLEYQPLVESFLQEQQLAASEISIIIVSDEYLRNLHKQYLNDDTETDVMTFNLGEGEQVEGEIYISYDRAKEQAREFDVDVKTEVARLVIHGLLHLKGYNDSTIEERREMRQLEDEFLPRYFIQKA